MIKLKKIHVLILEFEKQGTDMIIKDFDKALGLFTIEETSFGGVNIIERVSTTMESHSLAFGFGLSFFFFSNRFA